MSLTVRSHYDSDKYLEELLNSWIELHGTNLFKNCGNCNHMHELDGKPFCHKFLTTPPLRIILSACPEHHDTNEIPF